MEPQVRLMRPLPREREDGEEPEELGTGLRAGGLPGIRQQALGRPQPRERAGSGTLGAGPTLAAVAQGSPTRAPGTPSAGPRGSTSPSPASPSGSRTTRGEPPLPAFPPGPAC